VLASSRKYCILVSDFNLLKGVQMTNSEIEAFFLKAMRSGYAGGGVGKTMTPPDVRPSTKEIRFVDGDWLLIDEWNVNRDTNKSTGVTRIWHDGTLVWFMSYGGYYPDELIRPLKKALRLTYEKGVFKGGRGETVGDFEAGVFYVNTVEHGDFSHFKGREEIVVRGPESCVGQTAGYHEYWGMSLI